MVLFFFFFAGVPLPSSVGVEPTVVLDQGGRTIAELTPQATREDIALADLPLHVSRAVLAGEDARFYEHKGISIPGIFRAAIRNVTRGQVSQGGSTISQQYIKNVTDQREQTFLRKIREAALAVKLERQYSKDQILEFYLNTIYFGRGADGIQAAARAYFDKPAAALSVAEAAQLAAVIPAPSALDPLKNPEGAHRRYRSVIERMAAQGWLGQHESQQLAAQPPPVTQTASLSKRPNRFFLDMVERELARRLGDDQVYRGLTVTTTLDLTMQDAAERHFTEAMANADDDGTGALVSLDPATGGIRALVAGRDGEQINLVRDASRQPGSTFKAFALGAWIEKGKSPESTFEAPASMQFGTYEVNNYGDRGYDRMTLREASWKSVNTVYAQVADEVGPGTVADLARRTGMDRDFAEDLTIVLGSSEVTPLQLATGFNAFANGGYRRTPFTVLKVERDGEVVFTARPGDDRAFSAQVAWTTTDVLRGVIQSGTGRAADIGRPAAGKTGTTTNYADAWFAGYTPHLTTVVWYGNRGGNQGLPSKPTGGGLPATLWGKFMRDALDGVAAADFPEPGGSLEVVGEPLEPSESETPSEEPCPPGTVRVTAEGEDEDEADELQRMCVPEPSESPSDAFPGSTLTPTPTVTPTLEPTATGSPSPQPTGGPTGGTETASPSPSASAPG